MKDKKVKITYIERNLAAKYGVKPIYVSPGHAQHLVSKGYARILQAPPYSNPDITTEELNEIKKKYEEDSVSYVLEEKLLTKITWVSGGYIDRDLRSVGNDCGFRITVVNNSNFSIGKLLFADLIIVSSNFTGFSESQLIHLRAIIFQKNIPYVFRLEEDKLEDESIKHFLMDSKMNIFINDQLFMKTTEVMGEMLDESDWFIETEDPFDFWRKVNEIKC